MGVAVARSISYGAAYTEYMAMKAKAVFLGAINFDGDYKHVFDNSELDGAWLELRDSCPKYNKSGKRITRNVIKLELSPSVDESKDWRYEDYRKWALKIIKSMDAQTIPYKKRKRDRRTKQWVKDKDGKDKWFSGEVPRTNFLNSKILMVLHKDSKSGIWHVHAVMSRADINGNINDDAEIAKRAARAAEMVNKENKVVSAEKISEEHKAEIKDVVYEVLRSMEIFSWSEFKKAIEAKTFTDYRGRMQHYEVAFRHDSNDNVVGYSIKRGNSKYNASEIGAQLTAKKIMDEWRKVGRIDYIQKPNHKASSYTPSATTVKQSIATRQSTGIANNTLSLTEKREPTKGQLERKSAIDKALVVLRNFAQSHFNVLDDDERENMMPGIIANAIDNGFDTSIREGLSDSVINLLEGIDESAKVLCEALRAVTLFFLPADAPSIGSGGGSSNNDLPKKKDDEWEWWKKNSFGKKRSMHRKGR